MDECPTCERKFEKIEDFPLIHINSISILEPEKVPESIPSWYDEDLLEKKTKGWKREIVPAKVLAYFKENSDKDELIHSDGFIYKRPFEDTKEYKERQGNEAPKPIPPKFWKRSRNYSVIIKKIITENSRLTNYFKSLEQLVGKEVQRAQIFPKFKKDEYFRYTFEIPGTDYNLGFSENKASKGIRKAKLIIMSQGPNLGSGGGPTLSGLLTVGKIEYEGRIKE